MANMSSVFDENAKIWYGGGRREDGSLDENVSVGEWAWRMMRSKSPNETCQISDADNTHLTYHRALSNAIKLAKHMRKWKLTCYDVIGVLATNSGYTMQIILAAWFSGLAFHAINPEEMEEVVIHYLLSKTKPKVVFCDGLHMARLENTLRTFYPIIVCTLCNHLDNNLDAIQIEYLLEAENDEDFEKFSTEPLREGSAQTVAILCTSGTTGLPKCVRITNKMCLTDYGLPSENSSTVLSFCNIDWIFGFYGLLRNIIYGNPRVIPTRSYSAEYMAELISKYKVNCLLATPQQISQSIAHNPELMQTLRFVLITGSFCFENNLQQIRNTLANTTVINIYGTSECGGIAANFGDYKPQSVGQLFANVELKIIDRVTGEKLGPHETGVLCVKNNFHGNKPVYEGDVDAFYRILDAEDFIITGDVGCMDSEHYLYLSDRHEIVLQYQNIYYSPHEYETIVAQMKYVEDVCVVGVPEAGQGYVPAAVVVKDVKSTLTKSDIINYVNLRRDSRHTCFDYGVFFVNEIPRNHRGKVLIKNVIDMCRSIKNKENV